MKKIPSGIWCITSVVVLFGYLAAIMGLPNMLNTIMKTAHDLLLNTVFYLMSICVITGAIGRVFVEFGVVTLLERTLRPLMRPIFNLPGVTSLGAVMTFLSDNPAIISLANDKRFASYFKKYRPHRCVHRLRMLHTPHAALRPQGLPAVCRGERRV